MSGDDRDRDERPRRSWREIDQMRDRPGSRPDAQQPRGRAAEARAQAATQQYLKGLDGLFKPGPGGAEGERLARSVRDAHGTPEFTPACRAYRESLGLPQDPGLLALFLDAREPGLVAESLDALTALLESGRFEPGSGLRSQVRILTQDSDDAVAEAAEALLERL